LFAKQARRAAVRVLPSPLRMSDTEHTEPEPGLRKSFWEHVDDLRRALLRSAAAVGIALIACLLLSNYVIAVLTKPLDWLDILEKPKPTVAFKVGEHQFGPYIVSHELFAGLPVGEAPHMIYQVGTATVSGAQVVTLAPIPPPNPHKPESSLQVRLSNFSPQEGFLVSFRVSLYAALIVSSPIWLWQVLGFVLPALNRRERQAIFPWLAWGVVLFMAGVVLTYFCMLPLALRAAVMYSNWLGFDGGDWRASEYIGFASKCILGMGIGFQFPIVVLFLVKVGMLTHHDLSKYRRHVIVINFILGAVLTTPEWVTQVAMAVPLCMLYEVCILIARYWDWKARNGEAAAARLRLRLFLLGLLGVIATTALVRWDAARHPSADGQPVYFWSRIKLHAAPAPAPAAPVPPPSPAP
jgi:sec-independent protein translocase protein TatC